MDRKSGVHLDSGTLFSHKKKWAIKPQNSQRNLKCIISKWKQAAKNATVIATLWLQPCDTLDKAEIRGQKKDRWLQGVKREGEMNSRAQKILLGQVVGRTSS